MRQFLRKKFLDMDLEKSANFIGKVYFIGKVLKKIDM